MRKLILLLAMLPALAACTIGQLPPVSPAVSTLVGYLPEQVKETTVKVCGYLPAAETVASLISAFGGPTVPGIASQIAAEICNAVVQPRSSLRRAGVPTVRGVAIRGHFV
jgi:hypothetical protein